MRAPPRYPDVMSEDETLDRALGGASIGRLGDGEFKLIRGSSIKSQQHATSLAERLTQFLLAPPKNCIAAIPNINSETPKAEFWNGYRRTFDLLSSRVHYGSSFISRPDSAPWIDRPDYWTKIESLWRGLDVTLVRGSTKSLVAEDLVGAGNVTEVIGPRQNAWAEYESLLERIGTPRRALLCLGPTATVMAADLCARGVHAIDLGHCGMFIRKHRRGEPMWVTKQDKTDPG